MSFLKSYYSSVSSYLIGDETEGHTESVKETVSETPKPDETKIPESKSESWLGGMYNNAYSQTGEIWQAVKSDLSEFATVLSKDAKTVAANTAAGVKTRLMALDAAAVGEDNSDVVQDKEDQSQQGSYVSGQNIKATLNRVLDQVSNMLYIPPESDDEDYFRDNDFSGSELLSKVESRIQNMERDAATFQTDPGEEEMDSDLGQFREWKTKFNIDDFQSTIAELIKTNQNLFDQYAELVPRKVAHEDFWARYFYRVASIKAEESRREIMKFKLDEVKNNTKQEDWDETVEPSLVAEKEMKEAKTPAEDDDKKSESFKIKEKDGVVLVQHSTTSSNASDDVSESSLATKAPPAAPASPNNIKDEMGGWDDDMELDTEAEPVASQENSQSRSGVTEEKWDDWS